MVRVPLTYKAAWISRLSASGLSIHERGAGLIQGILLEAQRYRPIQAPTEHLPEPLGGERTARRLGGRNDKAQPLRPSRPG